MSALALERIAEAKRTRATRLDLGRCDLKELPEELFELTWLKKLILYANYELSDLNPLSDLTQLQQLDVSYTQVSDLTPLKCLKQLKNLETSNTQISDLSPLSGLTQLKALFVASTQVSDLKPLEALTQLQLKILSVSYTQVSDLSPLSALKKLQQLDVHNTQISDLSPLSSLTQLKRLFVSYTQVSDLSPLSALKKLQQLEISNTQVSDLSPLSTLKKLQQLFIYNLKVSDLMPLATLTQLQELNVQNCPIQYIPKEIYDQDNCAKDLYTYWQDQTQSQTTLNNQLKIMFLGNGCVGKTTLLHWFLDNAFKDLSLEDGRTHGIIIQPYNFKDSDVLAHFWDFGGQEVYHATHRLFLGRRSLYLLVWATESPDAAHEERYPPQYWLDMIADIGEHERSRVLIVQNLFDGQTERNILTDAQRQDYEKRGLDITTYCINAKTGVKIKSLKSAIEEEAEQLLKTNIEELPTSWVNIRKAVADKRLAKDKTLARADFENICHDCGLTTDPTVILGYLHRAGELFHYDNQFDNQIILDQEWALKAVYAVLKRDRIERYKGVFTFEDLRDFWQKENPNLTDDEAKIFLNFMLANKTMFYTEGGYQGNEKNPEFVVPQLLPTTEPNRYRTWQRITDKTRHRIQYTFLHRDIIERFIVATAHLSKNKDYWRNGLFIEYAQDEAMIEVVTDAQDDKIKYIHIECTGTTQTQLLQTIREEFNKIRTLDKAKEYRFINGNWEQIAGEIIHRAENMGGFKEKELIFEFSKKDNITSQFITKDSMKQYLQSLVSKDKLTEALELMSQISNTQNRDFKTTVILLSSRNAGNENDNIKGLLDESSYKRSKAQINFAILHLLDNEFDESKAPTPPKVESKPTPEPKKQPNTEGTKPKVYFSYAWDGSNETGESREKIVQELYESLKADGYNVRRDKEEVGYKDSIEDFMREIGRGSFIVVTISDKYLKSPNCMFELLQIYRKSNSDFTEFKDKIYPIVLGDAKIYDPMDVLDYAIYWQEKKDKLEAKIKVVGLAMASGIIPDFDKFNEIANNIALISRMISSINTLKPKMLSADNFAEIKRAIAAKANNQ